MKCRFLVNCKMILNVILHSDVHCAALFWYQSWRILCCVSFCNIYSHVLHSVWRAAQAHPLHAWWLHQENDSTFLAPRAIGPVLAHCLTCYLCGMIFIEMYLISKMSLCMTCDYDLENMTGRLKLGHFILVVVALTSFSEWQTLCNNVV